MNDLCIVINTCKTYFTGINDLLKQIDVSYISKNNVIVVSGQEDSNSIDYHDGYKIIKVNYTGLHLTGLMYICENMEDFSHIKYWMLLPDTIKFGDNFFKNMSYYYNNYLRGKDIFTLPFINPKIRPTMDMGILHTVFVMNLKNYLKMIKTSNIEMSNLINIKKQLIVNENLILGLPPQCYALSTKFSFLYNFEKPNIFVTENKEDLIETLIENGEINQVYFKNLDLYKFQRNFRGFYKEIIMKL
jgi:hypothetical protein